MRRSSSRPLFAALVPCLALSCAPAEKPAVPARSTSRALRATAPERSASGVTILTAEHDVSAPLRLMTPLAPTVVPPSKILPLRRAGAPLAAARPAGPDAALQVAAVPGPYAPTVGQNLLGVGYGLAGVDLTQLYYPPDTNGAVGKSFYVQMTNMEMAAWSKTGTVVLGPIPLGTIWQGFTGANGLCANGLGDPVVVYDAASDRFVVSQLGIDPNTLNPPYFECVAVSQTGDPTGAWNRYAVGPILDPSGVDAFDDYPKFGVWPDGYYVTFNLFNLFGTSSVCDFWSGWCNPQVCALDRSAMLAGQNATAQCVNLPASEYSVLPASVDGQVPPPDGSPEYLLELDPAAVLTGSGSASALELFRFQVDWQNAANTSLTGPSAVPVASYTLPCGGTGGTCVPQPAGAGTLDTLGDRLMFRLAYRNFGDHEELLAAHSVDTGTQDVNTGSNYVGVRWYELQSAPGQTLASADPVVAQQATWAPADGLYRWMPSIAMDGNQDLAVGYSVSNSTTTSPGIRVAARASSDPANALTSETSIVAGGGQQTTYSRWGDYSAMTVDPSDDCTFWYTDEYYQSGGSIWSTRIASLKLSGCPPATSPAARYTVSGPATSVAGQSVTFTVTAYDVFGRQASGYAAMANVTTTDPGAQFPATVTFVAGAATVTGDFTTAGNQRFQIADAASPALSGSAVVAVSPGPAKTLGFTALPATAQAGTPFAADAAAFDAYGNVATSYAGTANATVPADPNATLPGPITFTGGIAAGVPFTLVLAGNQTLTLTDTADPTITGSGTLTVLPGPAVKLTVDGLPPQVVAGQVATFAVTARDKYDNYATSYTGQVGFASSDAKATLPGPTPVSQGLALGLTATFGTSGLQTLTATDAQTGFTGATSVTVLPAGVASYVLAGVPASATAGAPIAATVTAYDADGNVASNYSGPAVVTCTGAHSVCPATAGFASGIATFSLQYLDKGAQTVTVTDGGNPAVTASAATAVAPGEPMRYAVTPAQPAVSAGEATTVDLDAVDAYGNVADAYAGTAALTSSDPKATLPATATFTAGSAHGLAVTLATAGDQTVTATDTQSPGLTGSAGIQVAAGAAAKLEVTDLPVTVTAGAATQFTVTAHDAFDNVATTYAGPIAVTSTDARATLPDGASAVFVAGVARGLMVTFATQGPQTLTATDAAASSVTGSAQTNVALTQPTVAITEPADGATVEGPKIVSASASVGVGATLASLDLAVDGKSVYTTTKSPANLLWDPGSLPNGKHDLTATATDSANQKATAKITVNVQNPPKPLKKQSGCGCGTTDPGSALFGGLLLLAASGNLFKKRRLL